MAAVVGSKWTVYPYSGQMAGIKDTPIHYRKLMAVCIGLATFANELKNTKVIMMVDNQAICQAINAGTIKCDLTMNLIRSLYYTISTQFHVIPCSLHIPCTLPLYSYWFQLLITMFYIMYSGTGASQPCLLSQALRPAHRSCCMWWPCFGGRTLLVNKPMNLLCHYAMYRGPSLIDLNFVFDMYSCLSLVFAFFMAWVHRWRIWSDLVTCHQQFAPTHLYNSVTSSSVQHTNLCHYQCLKSTF